MQPLNDAVTALFQDLAAAPQNANDGTDLWPVMAACSITAASSPQHIVPLFHAARARLPSAAAKALMLQRLKEALAKMAVVMSLPRTLETVFTLVPALAELSGTEPESVATAFTREYVENTLDYKDRGLQYMRNIFREQTDGMVHAGEAMFPDVMLLGINFNFGVFMSDTSVLSSVDTSMALIAALVPMDAPAQLVWNMRGLLRNGGTMEQVEIAKGLSEKIVALLGWPLTRPVAKIDANGEEV